jgi:hypothetical protein
MSDDGFGGGGGDDFDYEGPGYAYKFQPYYANFNNMYSQIQRRRICVYLAVTMDGTDF